MGRRYYLYDGEELVCELDAAGNAVAGVVFGAKGLLVYDIRGYQFDPQGNAAHLMDDDGLVLSHLAYDAWGQRMSGNNPTPYGYKGQWGYYTDVETGILLLTHRYLDPATGRFLTRDPIGLMGGINLYAYVGNGVVIGSDARGLSPVGSLVCRRIVIGIGTAVSDGPLPVGDIVACGIAIITICEVVREVVQEVSDPAPKHPPCSALENRGFRYNNPDAALRSCLRVGEKPKKSKGPQPARDCIGGKHYSYNTTYGRHLTVLCCPCEIGGVQSMRCLCKEH